MRNIHTSGNGTAAGLVDALGWDAILTKTSQEALQFTLDAFAKKVGLVAPPPVVRVSEVPGIAIPDFPMEEKGVADEDAPSSSANAIPTASDSWPELAAPGDMGYVPPSPMPGGVKPNYGMDRDAEEITSEHRLPAAAVAPKPATPEPHD